MELEGRTALVTGASRGIGRAIAVYLAELGAQVAVNYSSSEQRAIEVVEAIKEKGGRAIAVKADVSNLQEVEAMFEKVLNEFGDLHILVNNAGITRDALLIRMKQEDWDAVLDTNLKGVYNCSKAAAKIMIKKRRGKIINISSVVGVAGNAGQSNYAAAKAGVIGFSKAIARELAPRNIQVNVVAPGFIETDMTAALPESIRQEMLKQIPLGRYGDPMDVAYVVGFLASDKSQYITGQVIHVDGGMIM
ncbi:MAG: 3-oxoacyl-[acyl-carrier-protein] reductase [Caldicoprobacter oshimai]|uniref:3-oxoacyl-[acyl-carrier-protein] reductase n=1 Tax=Caldicoprobacter faecalis TaxID=937334 RepID=A0A1I5U2Y9_9FIRM|nr:3-oxoacyl-[acyl-carrier-protein] reductase [Caldicoprobacter faecalis]PZN10921.1 MAG: 3-oxoacyl-[acyl-carrier-protein] reductase [Caldicoprobacter oshimai]SFP89653.1 3-oxoacyl-[acyl-carrier-protein] reductase [Caldicoprobacter faecalis]